MYELAEIDSSHTKGQDLITAYRQKNRVHLPPSPGYEAEGYGAEDDEEGGEGIGLDEHIVHTRRMQQESRLLRFYPAQWQDILDAAKKLFRKWLAAKNPWPIRDDPLEEARQCLSEVLQGHSDAGGVVEAGYYIEC
jgi:hypothetical protein